MNIVKHESKIFFRVVMCYYNKIRSYCMCTILYVYSRNNVGDSFAFIMCTVRIVLWRAINIT